MTHDMDLGPNLAALCTELIFSKLCEPLTGDTIVEGASRPILRYRDVKKIILSSSS